MKTKPVGMRNIFGVLFLAGSAFASPSPLDTRQMKTGYQTNCVHGTAITFDDGPYAYETELVDTMIGYGAKSTLFVNGYNWGCIYDPPTVASLRHAYESNFTIAAHTWNHYDITTSPLSTLSASLDLLETALLKILGVKPALFRPPYGAISDTHIAYLNSRGYTVVGWSIDSGDSVGDSYAQQVENVKGAGEGDVVLAHEVYESTVRELIEETVPGLVQRGLRLGTVDGCLDVRAYQGEAVGYGVRDESWTCEGTPAPGEGGGEGGVGGGLGLYVSWRRFWR